MRIIDLKLYLLMILVCGLLIVFMWKNKRENPYEKLIDKIKYLLYVIPLLWLCLIIYLEVITKTEGIQIHFKDILSVSFLSSIEILLSAQISKNIISFIRNKALSTKYGGKELTKEEIDYINNSKELSSNLWGCILMFIMCGIIYSMINEFIFNEYKIESTLITAFISTICYWFISGKLFGKSNKK